MRKLCLGLSFAAMVVLAACGNDSGSSANDLGESSSSGEVDVIESCASGESLSSSSDNNDSSSSEETSSSSVQYSSSSEDVALVDPSTVVKGTMTDERDGQTYKTVKIGNQTWMAENLNYRYLGPTTELDSSSFCYKNDPANCTKYGRMYMWSAAMDSAGVIEGNTANGCGWLFECSPSGIVQGVCPKGWHLPSLGEWNVLFTAVGGSSVAGKMLKSETGWNSYGSEIENTDSFGFSVLPAGDKSYGSNSNGEGYSASFWSSTEFNFTKFESPRVHAHYVRLYYDFNSVGMYDVAKYEAFSVRCLTD